MEVDMPANKKLDGKATMAKETSFGIDIGDRTEEYGRVELKKKGAQGFSIISSSQQSWRGQDGPVYNRQKAVAIRGIGATCFNAALWTLPRGKYGTL